MKRSEPAQGASLSKPFKPRSAGLYGEVAPPAPARATTQPWREPKSFL